MCLRACVALEIGWDAPAVKGVYLGMEPVNRFPHFQLPPTEYYALALATEVAFFQWDAGVLKKTAAASASIGRTPGTNHPGWPRWGRDFCLGGSR